MPHIHTQLLQGRDFDYLQKNPPGKFRADSVIFWYDHYRSYESSGTQEE